MFGGDPHGSASYASVVIDADGGGGGGGSIDNDVQLHTSSSLIQGQL